MNRNREPANIAVAAILAALLVLSATAPGAIAAKGSDHSREGDTEEEIEDTKLNTEDAVPVAKGNIELSFSFGQLRATRRWDRAGDRESRAMRRDIPAGVEAACGVRPGIDVTVGTVYVDLVDRAVGSGSGLGDSYVMPKISIWVRSGLHVALLPGLVIPTGCVDSRERLGTGDGYWAFTPGMAVTQGWERWTSNVAVVGTIPFAGKERETGGSVEMDVALGCEIREWLEPEVELNYLHDFSGGGSDDVAMTVGLILPLGDHFRAELGGQQAVLGRNTDQTTSWLIVLTPILGRAP